jgi:membrane-associated protease RseP (regulator of RpoE activity)
VTATLADRGDVERAAMAHMAASPVAASAAASPDPVDIEEGRSNFAEPPPPTPAHGAPMRGQTFLGTVLRVGPFTGLELEVITPQLAGFFGSPDGKGLLIQSVTANSPAAEAGLRAGDMLLKADGVPLHTTTMWNKRLRAAKGKPVVLTVLRDKQTQQITLTLEAKRHSMLEWPHAFHAGE